MTSRADADSVLVIHPARLFAEALAAALREAGLNTVSHRESLPEAETLLRQQPSQVAVAGAELATNSTDTGGVVKSLLDAGAASVVVLAPTVQEQQLLAALEAGALGFISRQAPLERLVYDIKGALRGEACLPRDKLAPVLRLLIDRRREEDEQSERLRRLSRREHEVLTHLGLGMNNDEIASALFLSRATVRTHVQNILGKLRVHSRLEAIALVHDQVLRASSEESPV